MNYKSSDGLITITESQEHPGYWDISRIIPEDDVEEYTKRPIAWSGVKIYLNSIGYDLDSFESFDSTMHGQVMPVKISDIRIHSSRRPVDMEKAQVLADSIKTVGLLNPITVTQDHTLIAGAHRLEACKLLGMDTIDAITVDLTGLYAELAEIDENLIRNELHYTLRGEQLARRKEIYEELYPETKVGSTGNKGGKIVESEIISFSKDTADKVGVSRRTVEQEIQIARDLAPIVSEAVRQADIPKNEALKLARMEPDKQMAIAEKLLSGEARTVADAQREVAREAIITKLESVEAVKAKAIQGAYDVVVIDPPVARAKDRTRRAPQSGGI